ncbi:MAG TPA: YfhO family protein, partial [Isosphaeraceae bacterium]
YPPKLLVFWALAVSALAGVGWDRLVAGRSRRAAAVAGCLLAASLIALAASRLGAGPLRARFDRLAETLRTTDEPLDVARAIADLRAGLAHGTVVAAGALGLVVLAARRPAPAGAIAVGGLMLDLCLANAGHVVTVPQAAFEGTPRALEAIRDAERADPSPGPFRVQRVGRWWPTRWSASGAPRRFEEITRWERDSLRPHYGQPLGVRSTFDFDTIEPLDYGLFFLPWTLVPDPAAAGGAGPGPGPGRRVWYYPRRGFDLWNTRYFIVPARLVWDSAARGYAAVVPRTTFVYPAPGSFDGPDGPARRARWEATDDFRVLRNEAAFPRAWVVHRARLIPRIRGLRVADRAGLMQQLLYQDDEFWHVPGAPVRDPRGMAWVETDRPKDLDRFLSRAAPDPAESATVTRDEPGRVELTAVLRSPGLVVVADRHDPGWTLTVDGRPAAILRTNRAMRGVALPAGTHHLVFRYDPLSFRLGSVLSVIGLAALAALVPWTLREPSRPPDPEPA